MKEETGRGEGGAGVRYRAAHRRSEKKRTLHTHTHFYYVARICRLHRERHCNTIHEEYMYIHRYTLLLSKA